MTDAELAETRTAIDACYGMASELQFAVAFMELAATHLDCSGPWALSAGGGGPEFDDGSVRRLIERASKAVRAFHKAATKAL